MIAHLKCHRRSSNCYGTISWLNQRNLLHGRLLYTDAEVDNHLYLASCFHNFEAVAPISMNTTTHKYSSSLLDEYLHRTAAEAAYHHTWPSSIQQSVSKAVDIVLPADMGMAPSGHCNGTCTCPHVALKSKQHDSYTKTSKLTSDQSGSSLTDMPTKGVFRKLRQADAVALHAQQLQTQQVLPVALTATSERYTRTVRTIASATELQLKLQHVQLEMDAQSYRRCLMQQLQAADAWFSSDQQQAMRKQPFDGHASSPGGVHAWHCQQQQDQKAQQRFSSTCSADQDDNNYGFTQASLAIARTETPRAPIVGGLVMAAAAASTEFCIKGQCLVDANLHHPVSTHEQFMGHGCEQWSTPQRQLSSDTSSNNNPGAWPNMVSRQHVGATTRPITSISGVACAQRQHHHRESMRPNSAEAALQESLMELQLLKSAFARQQQQHEAHRQPKQQQEQQQQVQQHQSATDTRQWVGIQNLPMSWQPYSNQAELQQGSSQHLHATHDMQSAYNHRSQQRPIAARALAFDGDTMRAQHGHLPELPVKSVNQHATMACGPPRMPAVHRGLLQWRPGRHLPSTFDQAWGSGHGHQHPREVGPVPSRARPLQVSLLDQMQDSVSQHSNACCSHQCFTSINSNPGGSLARQGQVNSSNSNTSGAARSTNKWSRPLGVACVRGEEMACTWPQTRCLTPIRCNDHAPPFTSLKGNPLNVGGVQIARVGHKSSPFIQEVRPIGNTNACCSGARVVVSQLTQFGVSSSLI
jgi:hypothetical protein